MVGIALSRRLPTLALVPEILTKPSMRASRMSNCSEVRVTSPPSRILKVKPAEKFVNEEPYLSIIDWISEAFPDTTSSIFPKLWNAISLVSVDHVLVFVLSKLLPDKAPKYWSQVSWIFSFASVLEVIPFM